MMRWFKDLKIRTKLLTGFVAVALIAGGIGMVGITNIRTINEADQKLYTHMTQPFEDLVVISEAFQRARGNVRDVILSSTKAEFDDYEKRMADRNTEINQAMDEFQKTLFTQEGKDTFKNMEKARAKYESYVTEMLKLARENRDAEALALLRGDADVAQNEVKAAIDKIVQLKILNAKITADSNLQTGTKALTFMALLVVAGMLLAVALGIFISGIISKPVNRLVAAANQMAERDLNIDISIDTRDEVGVLAKAFNTMAVNINEVLDEINNAAVQVAAGSRQVSDSSQALSQGSTEQAASVEEITASMTQVAEQTKQNAVNAGQASELSLSAKENAVQGNTEMQEMLKAMDEINESSENISKIIKVIDEIAFQTNILALNAAVEAARAGQHGKGFAVVAEEVRNLAARSANAAKETTALIEGSIKRVEAGTKIANGTAGALSKIVGGVAKTTELVGQIAIASNEQATGITQVNQAISEVARVVQTNSATAQEGAAASEELSGQAELLKEMVGKFTLKKGALQAENRGNLYDMPLSAFAGANGTKAAARGESPLRYRNEAAAAKVKISLHDGDFGKY